MKIPCPRPGESTRRRIRCLLIAAVLVVGLIPATTAAAVPSPDEIEYPEEVQDCPELEETISPFSEPTLTDYKDCKAEQIEQRTRRNLGSTIEQRVRQYHNFMSWFNSAVPSL